MQLIIEGGSSKADWLLIDSNYSERERFSTKGFHPLFHSESDIVAMLSEDKHIPLIAQHSGSIHYYGAGCSTPPLRAQVSSAFKSLFSKATMYVGHDLEAAAFATYRGVPEIACILGTGSNACLFDGKEISQLRPSLGYILGDEGSGGYFGQKLLRAFLYGLLPTDLDADFRKDYESDRGAILKHIYAEPHANVYFAKFTYFLAKHSENPFIAAMLDEGFNAFLDAHVSTYPRENFQEVNFVGSVAWIFKEQLEMAAKKKDIRIGHILRRPIDGLVGFHKKFPELVPQAV